MREVAHINGGKDWFGYRHQCIQQPRLSRFDRYTRKDRSVASTWRVDGEDCASLTDALAKLEVPPSLTVSEMRALCQFATPTMAKRDFADFQAVYPDLRTLADKGLVWWDQGKVSLLLNAIGPAIDRAESNASGTPAWDAVSPTATATRAAIAKATTPNTRMEAGEEGVGV
jgi:hypothetical protein